VRMKETISELQMERTWRTSRIIVAILITVLIISYWHTYTSIVEIWWRSDTFAHGFIIIPISLYLIWQRREVLGKQIPHPEKWGIIVMVMLVLLWMISHAINVLVVQQLAVVAMIPVITWAILGNKLAWLMAFPLAYLFFAVPMGEMLIPELQDITALITVKALQLTGVPVLWEGRFLSIPSGSFEVAEACSGIRYLIASLALGTLFSYLSFHSLGRKIFFILLSIIVPIIANGIRAYGIIMLADLSDYKLAVGIDHVIYGWIFFGFVMLLLFWMGSLLRDDNPMNEAMVADKNTQVNQFHGMKVHIYWAVLVGLIIVSGPLMALRQDTVKNPGHLDISLPSASNTWSGPFSADGDWRPMFKGATSEMLGKYRKAGDDVQIYIASYARQHQGAELINSSNILYQRKYWKRVNEATVEVSLDDAKKFPVTVTTIRAQGKSRMLWSWYEIGRYRTTNKFLAKIYYASTRIFNDKSISSVIVLAAELRGSETETRKVLGEFSREILPKINITMRMDDE